MKAKIKKKTAVMLCAVLAGAITAGGLYACSKETETAVLKENQSYIYAYVTSITGNEITYMEVEESMVVSTETESTEQEAEKSASTDGEASDISETSDASGMSQGNGVPGDMGEMPSGGEAPTDMGEMPTGEDTSSDKGKTDSDGTAEFGNKMSGNTVTTYIPVGIVVHTTADTETTFARLASGDLLKILVETDADGNQVMEEIWMM